MGRVRLFLQPSKSKNVINNSYKTTITESNQLNIQIKRPKSVLRKAYSCKNMKPKKVSFEMNKNAVQTISFKEVDDIENTGIRLESSSSHISGVSSVSMESTSVSMEPLKLKTSDEDNTTNNTTNNTIIDKLLHAFYIDNPDDFLEVFESHTISLSLEKDIVFKIVKDYCFLLINNVHDVSKHEEYICNLWFYCHVDAFDSEIIKMLLIYEPFGSLQVLKMLFMDTNWKKCRVLERRVCESASDLKLFAENNGCYKDTNDFLREIYTKVINSQTPFYDNQMETTLQECEGTDGTP